VHLARGRTGLRRDARDNEDDVEIPLLGERRPQACHGPIVADVDAGLGPQGAGTRERRERGGGTADGSGHVPAPREETFDETEAEPVGGADDQRAAAHET